MWLQNTVGPKKEKEKKPQTLLNWFDDDIPKERVKNNNGLGQKVELFVTNYFQNFSV